MELVYQSPEPKLLTDIHTSAKYLKLPICVQEGIGNCGGFVEGGYVYVPHPKGIYKLTDIKPENVFDVEHRGGDYYALKPRHIPERLGDGHICASGRLTHYEGRVYHIHDRHETWELCAALSR